jgi:hypothetical protein
VLETSGTQILATCFFASKNQSPESSQVATCHRILDRHKLENISRTTETFGIMFTVAHSTLQEGLHAYIRSPPRRAARPIDRGPDSEKSLTSTGPAKQPINQTPGQKEKAAPSGA